MRRSDPNRDFVRGDFFRDPLDRLFRLAGFADDRFTGARDTASAAPCIDIDIDIDIDEDEDSYEITAELAGIKPEDVHVELNQNVLTIAGEKRMGFGDEAKQPKKRSRRSERSYGRVMTRILSKVAICWIAAALLATPAIAGQPKDAYISSKVKIELLTADLSSPLYINVVRLTES